MRSVPADGMEVGHLWGCRCGEQCVCIRWEVVEPFMECERDSVNPMVGRIEGLYDRLESGRGAAAGGDE